MAHRGRIPRPLQLGPLPADPRDIIQASAITMIAELVFGGVLGWVVYDPLALGAGLLVLVVIGDAGFVFTTGFLGWIEYIKLRGQPGRPRA